MFRRERARTSTLIIRDAMRSDLPDLERIFAMNRGAGAEWDEAETVPSLESQIEGEKVIVAESGGGIVGFISLWLPENFVHHLYVRKDKQGEGIGRSLIEEALTRYNGDFTLKCVKRNRKAMRFYRKNGWVEAETGDGPDGEYSVMRRSGASIE